MRGIISKMPDCFLSADDEGVSGAQADGNSQAIS
jgi:hypothetical protein